MKITVEIADGLLAAARRAAVKEKTSLRQIVEDGVRLRLAKPRQKHVYRDLSWTPPNGKENWIHRSWDEVRDQIYERRGRG